MKFLVFSPLVLLVSIGCASTPAERQPTAAKPVAEPQLANATSSALVFEPNVPLDYPLTGLDRAPREPSAFFGYEEGVTESYSVYTDDDQHFGGGGWGHGGGHGGWGGGGWNDNYERRAVSVKSGVVER